MTATGCRWRSLTPRQEDSVRRCVASGSSPRDMSAVYGVSVRTIYRTLRRERIPLRTVRVGEYEAPFIVSDDGPVQMGPWVASRARAWDNQDAGLAASIATIAHDADRSLVPGWSASSRSEGRD